MGKKREQGEKDQKYQGAGVCIFKSGGQNRPHWEGGMCAKRWGDQPDHSAVRPGKHQTLSWAQTASKLLICASLLGYEKIAKDLQACKKKKEKENKNKKWKLNKQNQKGTLKRSSEGRTRNFKTKQSIINILHNIIECILKTRTECYFLKDQETKRGLRNIYIHTFLIIQS